jgi:hypothetical protein
VLTRRSVRILVAYRRGVADMASGRAFQLPGVHRRACSGHRRRLCATSPQGQRKRSQAWETPLQTASVPLPPSTAMSERARCSGWKKSCTSMCQGLAWFRARAGWWPRPARERSPVGAVEVRDTVRRIEGVATKKLVGHDPWAVARVK